LRWFQGSNGGDHDDRGGSMLDAPGGARRNHGSFKTEQE